MALPILHLDVTKAVARYKDSPLRDDNQLKKLCTVGFLALINSLETGAFEITGFSEKPLLRYLSTSRVTDLINNINFTKTMFLVELKKA